MAERKAPIKRRVLLIDNVPKQNTHKLNKHRLTVFGEVKPEVFKQAVFRSWNGASVRGGANIIYLADIPVKGGEPKLIARLYQAKRNVIGKAPRKKTYKMFGTFHHPDGTILRDKAFSTKRSSSMFETSEVVYPSRPPIPPNMNTLLKKLVKV